MVAKTIMKNLNHNNLLSMQKKPIDIQRMYFSNQQILLIGEGDFSFSSSLATQFGVANNMVATSLDSKARDLQKNYNMDAIENIQNLIFRGAKVFHGVNALDMATKEGRLSLIDMGQTFYDVINFNFPHAGVFREANPEVIREHRRLMQYFFKNAACMLSPKGFIYVSHKCGFPYDDWNLQELASMNGLEFFGRTPFCSSNFPGYKNRRGAGPRARETFILGKAAIYVFKIRDEVWIDNIEEGPLQTCTKFDILLQISNLSSYKENAIEEGHASSETPLLQIIAAQVASMQTLKRGKKTQRKFNSLKLMLKVMHLVVETPLAVHKITSLPATRSKTMQHWHRIQRLAIDVLEKVIKEEQNIKLAKLDFGVPKEGKRPTLISQPCAEENMCLLSKPCVEERTSDSLKDGFPYKQQCELQVEEALEIYEADDISYEALLESEGEEHEDLFCTLVEEIRMSHPTYQDMMGPGNIVLTSHEIGESSHRSTIDQEDMYHPHKYHNMYHPHKYHNFDEDQSNMQDDEDQSGMQGDEDLGDCKLSSGNMEGEDVHLESSYSLPITIINWMNNYFFSCFSTTKTIEYSLKVN